MKNRSTLTSLIMFAVLGILIGASASAFGQESERYSLSVQGTWKTSVTPLNCATGVPVAPAFPGILAFAEGGTMSGTSPAAPAVYGVWDRTGLRHFTFAFTSQRYDSNGQYIGSQTVRQWGTMAFNGDDFASTGTTTIYDVNGVQVASGCAPSTGSRFEF